MIKGITSVGKYVTVTVSGGSGASGPYISPGALSAGMVRYNSNSQNLEVYDGVAWIAYAQSYSSVGLTPEAEALLDWAKEKRAEEQRLKELSEKSPAIKDLIDQMNITVADFHDKIAIVEALLQKEVTIGTS
jgi:hypothetical protein